MKLLNTRTGTALEEDSNLLYYSFTEMQVLLRYSIKQLQKKKRLLE